MYTSLYQVLFPDHNEFQICEHHQSKSHGGARKVDVIEKGAYSSGTQFFMKNKQMDSGNLGIKMRYPERIE